MKDKEAKSLTKQLTRYAKVGGVVGKLATKLASQRYLGVKLDKEKHASEIRAALGSIKGPLMKVAQLSATIPDLLPDEYAQELMHLQSNAPPMGWLFVKRRMAAELKQDWQKNFIEFDKEATRAASLGQVHKAKIIFKFLFILNSDREHHETNYLFFCKIFVLNFPIILPFLKVHKS